MRWLAFILLAVAAVILQSSALPRLTVFGARPDLLLIITIFIALYAHPQDAVAGGWGLGLLADLLSIERLGLLALTYGAVAFLVLIVREYIFKYRASSQLVLAGLLALLVQAGWLVYQGLSYGWSVGLANGSAAALAGSAAYTALFAPVVLQLLLRRARWFGFPQPRYSYRGLTRWQSFGV